MQEIDLPTRPIRRKQDMCLEGTAFFDSSWIAERVEEPQPEEQTSRAGADAFVETIQIELYATTYKATYKPARTYDFPPNPFRAATSRPEYRHTAHAPAI
jgi:hypothetical protein